MSIGVSYPAPILSSVFNDKNFGSKSSVATDTSVLTTPSINCTTLNCNGTATLSNLNVIGACNLISADPQVNSITAAETITGSVLAATTLGANVVVGVDSSHQLVNTTMTTVDASKLHAALNLSGTSGDLSVCTSGTLTSAKVQVSGLSGNAVDCFVLSGASTNTSARIGTSTYPQALTLGCAQTAHSYSNDASPGDAVIRSMTGNLLLQYGAIGAGLKIDTDNNVHVNNLSAAYTLYSDQVSSTRINATGSLSALGNPTWQYWEGVFFQKPSNSTSQYWVPLASKSYADNNNASITVSGAMDGQADIDGAECASFHMIFHGVKWTGEFHCEGGNQTSFDFQVFNNPATLTSTLYIVLNHSQKAQYAFIQPRFFISSETKFMTLAGTGWTIVPAPLVKDVPYSTGGTSTTPPGTMFSAHTQIGSV